MARRYNLAINQGETYTVVVPVLNAAEQPVDATAMTVRGQIRAQPADTAVLHQWDAAAGNVTTGVGNVTLTVDADVSAGWTFRHAVYDVELLDGESVTRLIEGLVSVTPETTRL